jgi:LAO/AO transport system kinase
MSDTDDQGSATDPVSDGLAGDLLAGDHAALARALTAIENREPGYRDLVSDLHARAGSATIVGVTGSPGAGKSTLVDRLASAYRERGETVGVIAIDPTSPFTGGAVLGDRVRMDANAGDMGVFVRSMSARGTLGGLSGATADAITALDAFGKDRIIVETVGAGQNEIDVVRTADTVCVLLQPGSGDAVQTLKAGILEIADALVVNKADLEGVDRLVTDLREMIDLGTDAGSHRITDADTDAGWTPPIIRTVATEGNGVDDLLTVIDEHTEFLAESGLESEKARARHAEMIRTLLRDDLREMIEREIEASGGFDELIDAVHRRETDPYTVVDDLLAPVESRVETEDPHSPE